MRPPASGELRQLWCIGCSVLHAACMVASAKPIRRLLMPILDHHDVAGCAVQFWVEQPLAITGYRQSAHVLRQWLLKGENPADLFGFEVKEVQYSTVQCD